MWIKTRLIVVSLSLTTLSACTSMNNDTKFSNFYHSSPEEGTQLYPETYETTPVINYPKEEVATKTGVVVPESFHVGAYQSPTPPKAIDHGWVNSQNPQAYTIELANSDKPSQVANAMSKAPKNERMAELKYQRGAETYYLGLYGTYPTYEAAELALNTLPSEVKQGAGIKQWGSVQKIAQ